MPYALLQTWYRTLLYFYISLETLSRSSGSRGAKQDVVEIMQSYYAPSTYNICSNYP